MPDTRPSPDDYILGAELQLTGWRSYPSGWKGMTEQKDQWQSLREDGLDLFFPPVAESAADAQFRKQLEELVGSDITFSPHPWAWMFAGKLHLTQSSDWPMRVPSESLLDKKEAIIKKRIALLQRLDPGLQFPGLFYTYRELPRDMPAAVVGLDDAAQAALRQEWLQVSLDERAINREMEKTALPLVRVHAQMVEVDGPPPVQYADADLAAIRALAQKYAQTPDGGGEEG